MAKRRVKKRIKPKKEKNFLLFLIALVVAFVLFFVVFKGPSGSLDPGGCRGIENKNERELCMIHVAVVSQGENICWEEIENQDRRDECIFRVAICSNDISKCEYLTPAKQQDCFNRIGMEFDIVDVSYSQGDAAVKLSLENICFEPITIDRIAVYPTPGTQDPDANAALFDYTLQWTESKEFIVPVESKPYKLKIMTDDENLAPEIILSDWE